MKNIIDENMENEYNNSINNINENINKKMKKSAKNIHIRSKSNRVDHQRKKPKKRKKHGHHINSHKMNEAKSLETSITPTPASKKKIIVSKTLKVNHMQKWEERDYILVPILKNGSNISIRSNISVRSNNSNDSKHNNNDSHSDYSLGDSPVPSNITSNIDGSSNSLKMIPLLENKVSEPTTDELRISRSIGSDNDIYRIQRTNSSPVSIKNIQTVVELETQKDSNTDKPRLSIKKLSHEYKNGKKIKRKFISKNCNEYSGKKRNKSQ